MNHRTTIDPFTFDSGLWQIGQNLPAEDLIYKHSTSSFRIYNASDIEIDPRKLPLVIRIRGATNGLTRSPIERQPMYLNSTFQLQLVIRLN
ncbi:hypothetical protein [Bacillus cereus group sp. IBL03679]|uniref:hypothetical protein n=1 Tax=Bacillus cereus group sp. IBL03679 TaxID=3240095 RepID=UPI003D2F67A7